MNKRSRHTCGILQKANRRLGPPAAFTATCERLTMTASDKNMMSLSCNRVTDLLKFEVPYYICIPAFPSYISDSMQALCSVWLVTNTHKWLCHNSMFKARYLAKLYGKLSNIPTRENKSVRCVNPHFVTPVLQVKYTILCLFFLFGSKCCFLGMTEEIVLNDRRKQKNCRQRTRKVIFWIFTS